MLAQNSPKGVTAAPFTASADIFRETPGAQIFRSTAFLSKEAIEGRVGVINPSARACCPCGLSGPWFRQRIWSSRFFESSVRELGGQHLCEGFVDMIDTRTEASQVGTRFSLDLDCLHILPTTLYLLLQVLTWTHPAERPEKRVGVLTNTRPSLKVSSSVFRVSHSILNVWELSGSTP